MDAVFLASVLLLVDALVFLFLFSSVPVFLHYVTFGSPPDGDVSVHDLHTVRLLERLTVPQSGPSRVLVSPHLPSSGRLLAGGSEAGDGVLLWDLRQGTTPVVCLSYDGPARKGGGAGPFSASPSSVAGDHVGVCSLAMSPSRTAPLLAAAHTDGVVSLWDLRRGTASPLMALDGGVPALDSSGSAPSPVLPVNFIHGGRALVVCGYPSVSVHDTSSGATLAHVVPASHSRLPHAVSVAVCSSFGTASDTVLLASCAGTLFAADIPHAL